MQPETIHRKHRAIEYCLCACLLALAAWCFAPKQLVSHTDGLGVADFVSFYAAGTIAAHGAPEKIYDLALQQQRMSDIIGQPVQDVLPYLYLPHNLIFYAPLAPLSLQTAYMAWLCLNILFSLLLLRLLDYAGIGKKPGDLLLAGALLAISIPWMLSIALGHPTILITVGLLAGHCFGRTRPLLAGAVIAITAFKPQLAIIPVSYMLIVSGLPLWIGIAASSIILAVIDTLIFGAGILPDYIATLLHAPYTLHGFEPSHLTMANIRALLLQIFGKEYFSAINTGSLFLWCASWLAALRIAATARKTSEKGRDLGFGLAVALSCVCSPYMWVNSLVVLAIPLGYGVKYAGRAMLYPLIATLLLALLAFQDPQLSAILWIGAQLALVIWLSRCFLQEKRAGI